MEGTSSKKESKVKVYLHRYFIDAMSAMAQGLFASLLIGTIISTLGTQLNIPLLDEIGGYAKSAAGPAMAVAIGYALQAPPLVLFSLVAVGGAANTLGGAGGPLAVLVLAIIAAELGKLVSKKTKVDIIVTPLVTIFSGCGLAYLFAPYIGTAASSVGNLIMWATTQQPFLMGILVSVIVGVCAKCYGRNLATGRHVEIGESVGIIAAQSIGEPGTQLTMRTFHTGGVATAEDITQGLPRVEELFEARKPKGNAIISNIAGKVTIEDSPENANIKIVTVTNEETSDTYKIPFGKRISVSEGDEIEAGTRLIEGNINPHDILRVLGVQATQNYIVKEVQKVYRSQGVEINDKHIEIIVHQMLRKIKIDDPGDSEWLPGQTVDIVAYRVMNEHLEDEGKKPAVGENLLLGTTKAALATDSFLSAASFQETTRVLTEAAIKGKVDPLLGLKENVIIGKLIPAGTGLARYRRLSVQHNAEPRTAETADGQADVQ